jgi:hypothetical protein
MSRTFELACFETRQSVWVGQGQSTDFYLYTKEDKVMSDLEQFLVKHIGKPLYFVDSEIISDLFPMSDEQIKQYIENGLQLEES